MADPGGLRSRRPVRPGELTPRADMREARQTARHLVEGWAVEAAQQRRLAAEYGQHLTTIAVELRSLQQAAGIPEHHCRTCDRAAASTTDPATGGSA